ncbi:MAG: hypothetical protein AAF378_14710 [Cyanobacteria bacterium P01_A01_bin.84]
MCDDKKQKRLELLSQLEEDSQRLGLDVNRLYGDLRDELGREGIEFDYIQKLSLLLSFRNFTLQEAAKLFEYPERKTVTNNCAHGINIALRKLFNRRMIRWTEIRGMLLESKYMQRDDEDEIIWLRRDENIQNLSFILDIRCKKKHKESLSNLFGLFFKNFPNVQINYIFEKSHAPCPLPDLEIRTIKIDKD